MRKPETTRRSRERRGPRLPRAAASSADQSLNGRQQCREIDEQAVTVRDEPLARALGLGTDALHREPETLRCAVCCGWLRCSCSGVLPGLGELHVTLLKRDL